MSSVLINSKPSIAPFPQNLHKTDEIVKNVCVTSTDYYFYSFIVRGKSKIFEFLCSGIRFVIKIKSRKLQFLIFPTSLGSAMVYTTGTSKNEKKRKAIINKNYVFPTFFSSVAAARGEIYNRDEQVVARRRCTLYYSD